MRIKSESTRKPLRALLHRFTPNSLRWLLFLLASFAAVSYVAYAISANRHAPLAPASSKDQSGPAGIKLSDKKAPQTTINYVAIGDSLAVGVGATPGNGYVPRYQQFLATDNNATVNLTNLGVSGSTSANLLNALQTNTTMRSALQSAQVITFNIGGIDLLVARNTYKQNQISCGGVDNQDCLRSAVANFKTNWNGIIAEILALRANTSVSVRTIDIYNPFVNADMFADTFPDDGGLNDFQVFKAYLDEANNHIRTTTLANGISLGRVYRSFNGANGTIDPGLTFGLIAADLFHPNDAGHAIIADRLRSGAAICLQSPSGLTAWYRGENNANDTTVNGNNGSLENGATFIAGKDGQAFDFDGVDDSVLLPTINLGQDYTIEMWIKPAATQSDSFVHIASNDSGTSGVYGALGLFTDSPGNPASYSLKYQQANSERMATSSVIPPNQWSHIAITHSSSDGKSRIYINGVLDATSSASFSDTYDNPLRLGHRINGLLSFYKGQVDEASLYNRALSASEIQSIVNADSEGKCQGGTNLQISPATATVNQFGTQSFTATGGTPPYTFSIPINNTNASIDAASGLYNSPIQTGVDTVRVTDAALFTSDATVTVVIPCGGGEKIWVGGGATNNWSDAANWSCNQVPTSSDTVIFNSTNTKNAIIDVSISVVAISISGYTGTITVGDGVTATFNGAAGVSSSQSGGTFTNGNGTVNFNLFFNFSGGTFNAGSGTINFGRNYTQTGGTFNGGSSNINAAAFAPISLNGGTFNAPSGILTVASDFTLNGATFNAPSGTVVFAGDNTSWSIAPSDLMLRDLTINKSDGSSITIQEAGRMVHVTGTLRLTEGKINANSGPPPSIVKAEGAVIIDSTFGDQTGTSVGGNGTLLIQGGAPAIAIPPGASLPHVTINDPGATITANLPGLIRTGKINLQRGTVNIGSTDMAVGFGAQGNNAYNQSGGSFSMGAGNFSTTDGPFLLSQPDSLNPSTFSMTSGNFSTPEFRDFQITGGAFTASSGTTTIGAPGGFNNNFIQSGGIFDANLRHGTVDINARFTLTGGEFRATSGNTFFGFLFEHQGGVFTHGNGTAIFDSPVSTSLRTSGTTFNNLTVNISGSLTNDGGSDALVSGTLRITDGAVNGFNNTGGIQAGGDVIVEIGADGGNGKIAFSGSAPQVFTNNGGINPSGSWTIDKSGATLTLNSDLDLSNGSSSFNLTNGTITTGGHLVNAGTRFISRSAGFIIGNLRQAFPGGGQNIAKIYHVGTASGYSPVTAQVPITPGPTSGTLTPLTVGTAPSPHPLLDPSTSLSYYWTMSEGTGLSATLEFAYPQAAVNGNEGFYGLDKLKDGHVEILNAQIFISTNIATIAGVTDFLGDWTLSELPTPLVLTPTSPIVSPGNQIIFAASGGHPPYAFTSVNNSGATIEPAGIHVLYTAGPTFGVTDTIRVSDNSGQMAEANAAVVDPFVVINTNSSGGGSLRQATINANSTPGTQTITFNIPGPAPYAINDSLAITDSVVIDGTTQPGYAGQPIIELNANHALFGLLLSSGSSSSVIKGLVINRYRLVGIQITTSNNVIQGNYIGTDVSGNSVLEDNSPEEKTSINLGPFFPGGVASSNNNLIGGASPAERNILASDVGIGVSSGAHDNIVKGNYIGIGADGVTPLTGSNDGIALFSTRFNIIGGVENGAGNMIANHRTGVLIANDSLVTSGGSIVADQLSFGNAIRGNSIFSNTNLGIDITPNGVNSNDACDSDLINNVGQNFPVIGSVATGGGTTTITGTLNSEPGKMYTIDFYSSPTADPSGFGEGKNYLGSTTVTTPGTCNNGTPFSTTLPVGLSAADQVTATATDPSGNTSEFSASLGISPASIQGTVLDDNNQPMQGVLVELGLVETNTTFRVEFTDSSGRFNFDNVPLGGNYEVVPGKNNFTFTPLFRIYNNLSTSHDDTYTGAINSFTIGGKVTQDGSSLGGVTITLSPTNAILITDSTGSYAFNNLPSGIYAVTAAKPGTTFTPPTFDFPTPITSNQTADFAAVSPLSTLPGRIVYADAAGNIRAMNADGSGLVTLRSKTFSFSYSLPTLSSNGHKIVFNDTHATTTPPNTAILIEPDEIRTSNADGSSFSVRLNPNFGGESPVLSPDGSKIACKSQLQVFTFDASGGNQTQITSGGIFTQRPSWSPDGSQLVIERRESGFYPHIFKVNAANHILTQLTSGTDVTDSEPAWSPDGTRIAFIRNNHATSVNSIEIINTDGSNRTTIASVPVPETLRSLKWAPDSSRLAFIYSPSPSGNKELIAILPDPNNNDPLEIRNSFDGFAFDWGPDNTFPTPAGSNVNVQSGAVSITFPSATGANAETTITPISPASAGTTPGGFLAGGVAYEISTTANFTPPVQVCFTVPSGIEPTAQSFNTLVFFHNEGGILVDRTVSRDFNTRTICGLVNSFSPFVIAQQIDQSMPSIRGLLVDPDGKPLNDFPIALWGDAEREARTDSNGFFTFVNLTQGGNYTVQPTQLGYLYNLPYQSFLNVNGEETVVFTATQTSFSISGTALDETGNGMGGVQISLDGSTANVAITDGNGNYTFAGLPANGFFSIAPFETGLDFNPSRLLVQQLTDNLTQVNFMVGSSASSSCSWDGSTGDWNDASHWACLRVPTTTDAVVIASGNPIVTTNVSVTNLQLTGGAITCNAILTVSGSMNWDGGTINGTGAGSLVNNGTLTIGGAAAKTIDGRAMTNNGTVNWTGGSITFANAATFNNQAGATFNIQTDNSLSPSGASGQVFTNAGFVVKNAGAGTTTMGIPFNNSGSLTNGSGVLIFNSSFTQTSGSTTLAGGSLAFGQLANYQGGLLGGSGSILGSISNSGAIVAPGSSPGILSIDGNYTQGASGALNIELGGTTLGSQYDRLAITGTANLSGTLNVTLTNGFLPTNGNSFSVMTFASRAGDFSTKSGLDLGGGLRLDPVYTPTAFILSVTDQPTLVTLIKFEATGYDNGDLLEWQTGLEVNNLGFRIHRQDGGGQTLLNQELVAGSALVAGSGTVLTAGRSYAYWVDAKDAGKDAAFWLEDIDLNGASTWHGPVFAKQTGGKPPARSLADMLSQVGRASGGDATRPAESFADLPRLSQSGSSAASVQQASLASSQAVKIGVRQAGWYRVTQRELTNAGLDPKTEPRTLQLFVDGMELPINVIGEEDGSFDVDDSIEFYGEGLNTPSTDTRVYWLIGGLQPGLRISKAPLAKGNPSGESFPYTVERRDRTIYFSALRNGDSENFFGAVISPTATEQIITPHNLAETAENAVIEVSIQGVTNLAHQVGLSLNGSYIGQVSFNGQTKGNEKIEIPQAMLREGENVVTLQSINGPSDISLVESIRVTYQHAYRADDDSLSLAAKAGQTVRIGGFSTKDIRVLDVTDERNVSELEVSIDETKDGYAATVSAPDGGIKGFGGGDRKLLALTDQRVLHPSSVKANTASQLRSAGNGADSVIISRGRLVDSLKPLVGLRVKQGLKTALVDIEDVYDEFSFGDKSPESIRDFLRYATASWKIKPRFVLFAGDASYDPKNYLGLGDGDVVPTKLIDTDYLETASDDWLADFDGDGIADIAVGRLPGRTAEELSGMVGKIVVYEEGPRSEEALLVADANDGYDFEKASAGLRTLIPVSLRITQVDRGRVDAETARNSLLEGLNRRQFLVNYVGHGSANQWRGNLLTSEDAQGLRNEHQSVFVMMTCLNGYFQDPALNSLGESLMKAERGGAVAVWASSGMTLPSDQAVVNQELYRLLFSRTPGITIGEAVMRARAASSSVDVRRTWVLLGDPTMRLH